jgi:hypothetical protein
MRNAYLHKRFIIDFEPQIQIKGTALSRAWQNHSFNSVSHAKDSNSFTNNFPMPSLVDRFQRPFAWSWVVRSGLGGFTTHPMTASLSTATNARLFIVHFPSMIKHQWAQIYGFLDLGSN